MTRIEALCCSVCGGHGPFGKDGVRFCREHLPSDFWKWRDRAQAGPVTVPETTRKQPGRRPAGPDGQGRLL